MYKEAENYKPYENKKIDSQSLKQVNHYKACLSLELKLSHENINLELISEIYEYLNRIANNRFKNLGVYLFKHWLYDEELQLYDQLNEICEVYEIEKMDLP